MTTFQNIPHDVFITHIIPHMLNKYILKIQQENELLLNIPICCTCGVGPLVGIFTRTPLTFLVGSL